MEKQKLSCEVHAEQGLNLHLPCKVAGVPMCQGRSLIWVPFNCGYMKKSIPFARNAAGRKRGLAWVEGSRNRSNGKYNASPKII